MKIEIKGFEVYLGADTGANKWTLNIPKLKIFNTYEIKKDAISVLETNARELLKNY
ncbi:hypothetical protein J2X97_000372 [Epilithonimonas hungarica]|uniref:hypothetical protein n=1 Tax=Epilithonimonas hungarica TaxID=454006 RepID=UPI00278044C3|nr:hypothetical protein [Epilithonimonas hungarica]MDP9954735.1 hypothetical protein [Epilithonimonas hungarica]